MSLVSNISGRLPVGGEFQGFNGDCAEYGVMVGRTATSPQYPCDKATLDHLTSESITAKEAGPAGQMTDANAAWLCQTESIPFQQLPFNPDGMYYWLGIGHAVVCGFANGQALPGNESGVQGHCVCFLAHDDTGFTLANGDSVNGRNGQLDTGVPYSSVIAAKPTTMTVIHPIPMDLQAIKQDCWNIQARVGTAQADLEAILLLVADILKRVGA